MINENISDELKIYELSLIWKEAEYNFAFWERLAPSLDWDKAYREALPAVLKTKNTYEYYLELKKFVALLRDGHTGVWFPKAIEDSPDYTSKLPVQTALIGGERVIINVKRSAADKVKRWSIIKKVNGIEMDEYAEKHIYPYIWHEKKDSTDYWINLFLSNGPAGSSVELELENDGRTETVVLTRSKGDTDWFYNHSKPVPDENLREEYKSDSHRIAMTEDNIAVITIDTMSNDNLQNEFYSNFSLLEKARGYIIDVRDNGGGNSNNSDAVAAAFIGGKNRIITGRALHPIYIGAYKAWSVNQDFGDKTYEQLVTERGASDWLEKVYKIPRHSYYEEDISDNEFKNCPGVLTAPLVVLASSNTGSAAEDFLIELEHANRVTIVGSASFGSTGQPLFINLESGGGFRICTRYTTHPDGREFINIGVKPHIPFEITLDDYKNGVDSVMNKGLEVIRGMI
jgi:C-terminal processing protease CtpA/Prc